MLKAQWLKHSRAEEMFMHALAQAAGANLCAAEQVALLEPYYALIVNF